MHHRTSLEHILTGTAMKILIRMLKGVAVVVLMLLSPLVIPGILAGVLSMIVLQATPLPEKIQFSIAGLTGLVFCVFIGYECTNLGHAIGEYLIKIAS